MPAHYLNVTELAARLGRSRSTIYNRMRLMSKDGTRNLLPYCAGVEPVTGAPCWKEDTVKAWMAKCVRLYGKVP